MTAVLAAVLLSAGLARGADFESDWLYRACEGFSSGDAASCSALASVTPRIDYQERGAGVSGPATGEFLCRSSVLDLRMMKAAISGDAAGLARACEEHEAAGHSDFKKGKAAEACALLAARAASPKDACEALAPYFSSAAKAKRCVKQLRLIEGDGSLCPSLSSEPVERELCEGAALYREAAGKPARCAASPICRAMSGDAAACEAYSAAARLDKVERFIEDLEKRRSCSEKSVTAAFRDARLPDDAASDLFMQVSDDLQRLYLCRALESGNPGVCADLKAYKTPYPREEGVEPITFRLLCETLFYEARIAQAIAAKSPDVASLCVTRNEIGDRDFKLGTLQTSCAIVAGYSGSTAATCGALTPYFDNASIAKTCPKMLRFVSGEIGVCPLLPDHLVNERCLGYAAFRPAFEAGKPGLCGPSNYCRTLFGRGGTCGEYEKRVGETACRWYGSRRAVEEAFRAFNGLDESPRVERLKSRVASLLGRDGL